MEWTGLDRASVAGREVGSLGDPDTDLVRDADGGAKEGLGLSEEVAADALKEAFVEALVADIMKSDENAKSPARALSVSPIDIFHCSPSPAASGMVIGMMVGVVVGERLLSILKKPPAREVCPSQMLRFPAGSPASLW